MAAVVWVRTTFVGFHRWAAASGAVAFLRDWHRHVFHVRLGVPVFHNDRDVEFLTLKTELDGYIDSYYRGRRFESSCETIAEDLLSRFSGLWCEVSEDGENGATVTADDMPALKRRSVCFVGTEAEGPNRGRRMLFVPGGLGPAEVRVALASAADEILWGCYYGAGNDRRFRTETLATILELFPPDRVTVELSRYTDDLQSQIPPEVVVVVFDPCYRGPGWAKEIVGGTIIWSCGNDRIETSVTDSLFGEDRELT